MSGKNLFTIELDYLVAPKRVLKNQAQHISQLSDEMIIANVETARGNEGMDECFIHSFHISVPKLAYTARLFEVTHGIDMYPVQVRNDDWSFEKDCPNAASFELAVSEILNSAETKQRLEALRSQAFAEMNDPPSIEINDSTGGKVPTASPEEIEMSRVESMANSSIGSIEDDKEDAEPISDVSEEIQANVEAETLDDQEQSFEEWGDPIDFDSESVTTCPNQLGAAIIYNPQGAPLFIAYSKDIRNCLKRQLGRKASPIVSKARKAGLLFICGTVRSIDDAEQIVESRINTMPFRGLLGDSDSNDWM